MPREINAKIEGGTLYLEIPLEKPTPSKSGKMLLLSSSGGFTRLDAKCPNTGKVIKASWNIGVSHEETI